MDGLDESFSTLSDGMDGKLKKAATYFTHSDEIRDEDYAFRPDVSFKPGMTYEPKVCKQPHSCAYLIAWFSANGAFIFIKPYF